MGSRFRDPDFVNSPADLLVFKLGEHGAEIDLAKAVEEAKAYILNLYGEFEKCCGEYADLKWHYMSYVDVIREWPHNLNDECIKILSFIACEGRVTLRHILDSIQIDESVCIKKLASLYALE